MEQHNEQIRARITGTGNLLRETFACLFPVLGTLYAFSHAAVVLYLCAGVTGGYLPFGTCVPQPMWILLYFLAALGSSYLSAGRCLFLNADKHSPASSARSTKRRVRGGCLCQWKLKAPTDRSRSDCVHEQVAKLGPVSRAAGMDCECPLYSIWQRPGFDAFFCQKKALPRSCFRM